MSFQTICIYVWTRTTRRPPPLYAMTLRKNMRRGRVSAHPLSGQTGGLYPQKEAFVLRIQIFVNQSPPPEHEKSPLEQRSKRNRPPRKGDPKRTGSPSRGADFNFLRLLNCDLCASCFKSCLCLISCLLVDLLKKCCRCCINKILSFLESKCRVEVTYFLDNRNLL